MTGAGEFMFAVPGWRTVEPTVWLKFWAKFYEPTPDEVYDGLIGKAKSLSPEDFERIGRWKEGCLAVNNGRWKPKTPVGYDVWMKASKVCPTCPSEDSVLKFLECWSEEPFTAGTDRNGHELKKRFGLARSTTLLHFISGGRFPIFDARVGAAIERLRVSPPVQATPKWYVETFCPQFHDIANLCGVSDTKGLDNALFCYGRGSISFADIDDAASLAKSTTPSLEAKFGLGVSRILVWNTGAAVKGSLSGLQTAQTFRQTASPGVVQIAVRTSRTAVNGRGWGSGSIFGS